MSSPALLLPAALRRTPRKLAGAQWVGLNLEGSEDRGEAVLGVSLISSSQGGWGSQRKAQSPVRVRKLMSLSLLF